MKRGISVSLVALVLVLALASVGLAYTAWTDSVTISESVTTGTLGVAVENAHSAITVFNGTNFVAQPDGDQAATCVPTASGKAVALTVTNAYPGLKCVTTFEVKSIGSVPVYIDKVTPGTNNSLWTELECPNTTFGQPNGPAFATCTATFEMPYTETSMQNQTNISSDWTLAIEQWNKPPWNN